MYRNNEILALIGIQHKYIQLNMLLPCQKVYPQTFPVDFPADLGCLDLYHQ
jgi:hypothetical protein